MMDAKELDKFTNVLRNVTHKDYKMRTDVSEHVRSLALACKEIGYMYAFDMLIRLYAEIEYIDTDDIVEIGTFREEK